MIILGLTGSIGMGKSTACRMLARLGCAVHDSDLVVRKAILPGGEAFEEVAVTFPEAWNKKKHIIKRDILSDMVFNDPAKREELENILHPIAKASQLEFIRKQKMLGKKIAVLDIPLLFETGAQYRVDYTICMSAPYHQQKRRVLSRPGMTEDTFFNILNIQMPDQNKRAMADFVVETGLGYGHAFRKLKQIVGRVRYA